MDQTTYADAKIAAMANDYFVPVKVDTDERPDIDGYYQTAAQNFQRRWMAAHLFRRARRRAAADRGIPAAH